jgi:hypothetical protein
LAWKHSGVVWRFVRKVGTSPGAVAVQIVTRRGRQAGQVEHLGPAHTGAELALLLSAAGERLSPGQDALGLGDLVSVAPRIGDVADWTASRWAGRATLEDAVPAASAGGRPVWVNAGGRVAATSSQLLWQVLTDAYALLGLGVLADGAFGAMVLARIVGPASKADSRRVLADPGAPAAALRTLSRSLKRCRDSDYRDRIAKACTAFSATAGGLPALVMYDCTTLHFETSGEDAGPHGLRKAGMSKEHRAGPRPRPACSLTRPGSRSRFTCSRATPPRPPPCSRSCVPSGNGTG